MTTTKRNAGFTLVELAIVLVIIGLLVGGVLVGQDLIKQAEIRSVVEQVEKTNAAVNTFRSKFGGYPGDLAAARATQFGFVTRTGADGRGDGDGTIEGNNATNVSQNSLGGENAMFWRDLSQADMITEGLSLATDVPSTAALTTATLPNWLPQTKLRESTFVHVIASNGRNMFYIDNITATAATTGLITSGGTGLSVLEAQAVDDKLDDGTPLTGSVLAVNALAATAQAYTLKTATAPAAGVCVSNATGSPYNLATEDFQPVPSCGLAVRASF